MSRKQQRYIEKYKLEKERQKEIRRKAREKECSGYEKRQGLLEKAKKLGIRISA